MSLYAMRGAARRLGGQAVWMLLVILTARPPVRLTAQDSLPAGYGTLRRDDIQVLPLDEQVIRLLAPDTYRSLKDLSRTRQPAIDSLAGQAGVAHPTLVFVMFFGLVPQARFSPEDLNITSRGRLFRPVGMVPLSPRWNSYQLDAREQAVAIYLFDEGISFREDVTVSYQSLANGAWSRSLRALDRERARVLARVRAGR